MTREAAGNWFANFLSALAIAALALAWVLALGRRSVRQRRSSRNSPAAPRTVFARRGKNIVQPWSDTVIMQTDTRITIRVTEAERQALAAAAKRDQRTMSSALRFTAERYADQVTRDRDRGAA